MVIVQSPLCFSLVLSCICLRGHSVSLCSHYMSLRSDSLSLCGHNVSICSHSLSFCCSFLCLFAVILCLSVVVHCLCLSTTTWSPSCFVLFCVWGCLHIVCKVLGGSLIWKLDHYNQHTPGFLLKHIFTALTVSLHKDSHVQEHLSYISHYKDSLLRPCRSPTRKPEICASVLYSL